MRLGEALDIYELEGPQDISHGGRGSAKVVATKVAHLHLTPEEIHELSILWRKKETEGRGPFIKRLFEARERLKKGGYL